MTTNGGIEPGATGRAAGGRAQSETIGVVLVVAIVISGATLVVAIGVMGISDTEDQLADSRAEKGMTQFSSKAGLVALQEADSQQIDFATDRGEQYNVVPDTGWMNITWQNQTTGYSEEVMNMTLGAVVYEGKNRRFAYQGGGVFQETDTGGQMISPPEFHFRDGTLTLPAVNVTGDPALGGRATVTRSDVIRKFPTGVDNSTNPLDNHVVTVTVQSDYYRGWGEYFEERTDGEVEYDHAAETATLLMVTPIEVTEITAASASLSASGEFTVNGNSALDCSSVGGGDDNIYTDSYNSSKSGDYCDQLDSGRTGANGTLVYGDDVDIDSGAGGSGFCGDIVAGGSVKTQGSGSSPSGCGDGTGGQPMVFGNINYTDSCTDCSGAIVSGTGSVNKIDGIQKAAAVNWYINNTVAAIEDNAPSGNTNPTLNDGNVLSDAEYYFDTLEISNNDEIVLNTTGRDSIDIGVGENIILNDDASLRVIGDGFVRIFVDGDGFTGTNHLKMHDNSSILAPEDNARQLRLYGKKDFTAELGGGGSGNLAKYVGVLYAPPGITGTGEVVINGAEVYGGMLTGTTVIPSGGTGSIHYDEALREKQVIPPDANQVKVTYLHVTINQITVEG